MKKTYIIQFAARNRKLKKMGMTYSEYLKSSHWFLVKVAASREERFQSCWICGSKDRLQFHHKKYKKINDPRIGVQLAHLVALCRYHHAKVHELCETKGGSLGIHVKRMKKSFIKQTINM